MDTKNNSLFQKAEKYHFEFQKGMYLSERISLDGATIFYSDIIDDYFWNYATQIDTSAEKIEMLCQSVTQILRERERVPCFYVTSLTKPREQLLELLKDKQFLRQFADAWMFFEPQSPKAREISETKPQIDVDIQRVESPSDFIHVFTKAYGGEPSEDEPYGGLPETYIQALKRSFDTFRDVETYHFVAYTSNKSPASIATLVFKDGLGCIYNVGTPPDHRGMGLGTAVSQTCIKTWQQLRGHTLFLQTEHGSKVESWYASMGFTTRFVGEGWALQV